MRVAERATGPLGDAELDLLFAPFADSRQIALAVSGGADSLALLAVAARWQRRRGGSPAILVLTVDHRLRRGSRAEARMVTAVAAARGLTARVLTRKGPAPRSDVEGAARRARYSLLIEAAAAAGASHLLTAHHRDDVAEGFLLRLARGSGVFGLAAMRPAVAANGLTIARPLLSVPRQRLAATTAAAGLTPVADPMNADPRYARSRVRALLPLLAAEGIDPAGLAETAIRLRGAAEAIEGAATGFIEAAVATDDLAIARLEANRLRAAPREVRLRVLARLIRAVGGEDYPPRFERLSALLAAIENRAAGDAGGGRFKRTLGGTVIESRGAQIFFYRESGRDPPPVIRVPPGYSGVWDHRFLVEAGPTVPAGLTVGALGEDGRRLIGAKAEDVPPGAIAALPAARRGKRIVSVPGIGDFPSRDRDLRLVLRSVLDERLRQPPLFPDFASGE